MDHKCGSGLARPSVHGLLEAAAESFGWGFWSYLKLGVLFRARRIHFIVVIVLIGGLVQGQQEKAQAPIFFFK